MKREFLHTATAVATLFALSVFAPVEAQDSDAQTRSQDDAAGSKIDVTTWDNSNLYEGWSVEEFLDADVQDQDGEEIGEVEDLIVGSDGRVRSLVIEAGGFLDIGDTHFAYPWDQAKIEDSDSVRVSFDTDNIEDYSLFGDIEGETTGPRRWRVTELLNDYAALGNGVQYGWVDDVIISRDGQVQAVVVQPDVAYGVGGPYAWPYYGYDYGFDPGRDYYEAPFTEGDVAELEPFDYDRMTGDMAADAD